MILKKPYAFLIKQFKTIHLILMFSIIYLIYRTEMMISFLNDYISSSVPPRGMEIVAKLYNVWVFLLPVLIILFSIVLFVIMTIKKKPRLMYFLCIIVHLAILAVYLYGHSVFTGMEQTIQDLRVVRALRDLYLYCILFQGVFCILALIRGVGFDIKKFDFARDLQGLEISAADSEEFEIDFDFDISDKTRKGKRLLRYLKYKYKENKLIANTILCALVIVGAVYTYNNYNIYNRTNPEGTQMQMNGFTFGVHKSYLLNTDLLGRRISNDRYILVVDLRVKCDMRKPAPLNLGAIQLNIAGDRYNPVPKYEGQLGDLGIVYKNQNIPKDFTHYLLVFEIPLNALNSKMHLEFKNTGSGQIATVRLNYRKMVSERKKSHNYYLGDTIDFSESTLLNSSLKIQSFEIRDRFAANYRYCSRQNQCLNSVEYLSPNIFNYSFDKSLLKLEADFKLDEEFFSKEVTDLYSLIKTFGHIEYTLDGVVKKQTVYLGHVKSKKVKQNNIYYIEVFREIKSAERIALVFQVRNITYKYYLK